VRTLLRASLAAALAVSCACAGRPVQPEDDSDAAIRARIETVVSGRRDLNLSHVTIDVYSRVVTVTGILPEDAQLKALRRLIVRVPGVDQVIENVVVSD
jgi:osmotically-inducible protein OsmY